MSRVQDLSRNRSTFFGRSGLVKEPPGIETLGQAGCRSRLRLWKERECYTSKTESTMYRGLDGNGGSDERKKCRRADGPADSVNASDAAEFIVWVNPPATCASVRARAASSAAQPDSQSSSLPSVGAVGSEPQSWELEAGICGMDPGHGQTPDMTRKHAISRAVADLARIGLILHPR